jgi:hypothetical protein
MSVTSSGRSSIKRTIRYTSGWFAVMAFAIFCIRMSFRSRRRDDQGALPFRSAEEIHDAGRYLLVEVSRFISGWVQRREVVEGNTRQGDGDVVELTLLDARSAKNCSPSLGDRICP